MNRSRETGRLGNEKFSAAARLSWALFGDRYMIDRATGELAIRNVDVVIGPSLTRAKFLTSSMGKFSRISVENEPYCSFDASIPTGDLMGVPAVMRLYFFEQQLESVSITASDDRFGASWDEWSEEKEFERKRFHDQWLVNTIGTATGDFPWGQLSSDYDARSGCSAIHVQYSWQGRPWKSKR